MIFQKAHEFLSKYFSYTNIVKDDKVLIHSDIFALFRILRKNKIKCKIEDLVYFFLDLVGPEGCVIFPTFNFDFCKKIDFSYHETVSRMGILSETARKMKEGFKTWHPVYSFKVFGNMPEKTIFNENYSALGKDSIFQWLCSHDGKILIMNLSDQNSMTIYHHFEEMKKISWRFHKIFKGNYVDINHQKKKIETSIFVRNLKKRIITDVSGMEKILWSKNLYKSKNDNDIINPRSINVTKLKKEVYSVIESGKAEGILYRRLEE